MKKVYLKYTEGCCWRRVLDIKLVENYFIRNGYQRAFSLGQADLIVLETCAFVKRTEDIAIKEIKRFIFEGYGDKLIVIGCLPGINMPRLRQHFEDSAINTAELGNLNLLFPEFKHKLNLIDDVNTLFLQHDLIQRKYVTLLAIARYIQYSFSLSPRYWLRVLSNAKKIIKSGMGINRRHVRYIRIGWGCEKPHCTFCVEWRAVGGKVISKSKEVVLGEVRRGLKEGYKYFAIIADNPGQWGFDLGERFPELLWSILTVDPSVVITNIDGLHPALMWRYKNEYIDLLKSGRIRSIMSALQTGNNRILELMNRGYTREQYLELMRLCRSAYPDIVLITQVIVGFPSETFEEFKDSLDAVIEADITNVTLFPFYCNPLTLAAKIEGRVNDAEKFRRIEYAMGRLGRYGIFSFNLGIEIDPRHQSEKALYDQ